MNTHIAVVHEHYHVTDAGMRYVLESLAGGINTHLKNAVQYLWYSPRKYQGQETPWEKFSDTLVSLIEDDALGYLSTPFDSLEHFNNAVSKRTRTKLATLEEILQSYDTVIHLIQNPTLLKNPVETQANCRVAHALSDHNYIQIWHIHDLLEDSPARQALRDHIRQIAGPKTEEAYGLNGCGISWTTAPNIFYATINMKDRTAIKKILPQKLWKCIFYFPDPVDIAALRTKPRFSRKGKTLDDRILSYCQEHQSKGYRYDTDAEIMIASEFARERKNTGEQLLLLNMLNRISSQRQISFQLLITMVPAVGPDADRIKVFQNYIQINRLPVVMGFGSQLIARGNISDDQMFTMTDLWSHPRARFTISTAVKEGFGLNFINPAVATFDNEFTSPTVGRRLRDIFPDFEAAGMTMDENAFYDNIIVDDALIGKNSAFIDVRKNMILKDSLPRKYHAVSYEGIIELNRDFCSYSADEQILLMDLIDYDVLVGRLSDFVEFVMDKKKMSRIAKTNAAAIMKNLSVPSYIARLKSMIDRALVLKRERTANGEMSDVIRDNTQMVSFYKALEASRNGRA